MAEKNTQPVEISSQELNFWNAILASTGIQGLLDAFKPEPQITLQRGAVQHSGMQRIRHEEEVAVVRR